MEVSAKNNENKTVNKAIDLLCEKIVEKMSENEVTSKKKNSLKLNQWTLDALNHKKKIMIIEQEVEEDDEEELEEEVQEED